MEEAEEALSEAAAHVVRLGEASEIFLALKICLSPESVRSGSSLCIFDGTRSMYRR